MRYSAGMIFNGDTDGQDICTLADLLAKTDAIDFPLKEKATYANWGMREIWKAIYLAYGGWILSDSNQSTLDIATGTLKKDQTFYPLPDDVQALHEVEWMDASGSWHKILPITLEDINARGSAESEFLKISANPTFYRPIANGFKIYPASGDADRASALRCDVIRGIVAFTSTSTSTQPGFDSLHHEAVPIFMAMKYAQINSLSVAGGVMRNGAITGMMRDWSEAIDGITSAYKSKYKQMFPPKIGHRRNFVQQFL